MTLRSRMMSKRSLKRLKGSEAPQRSRQKDELEQFAFRELHGALGSD